MESQASNEVILKLSNVKSGYGRMEVLHKISLNVMRKEIVVVVGPNGAGKTTLLNTIFGIATLHSGDIVFEGKRLNRMRPHKIVSLGIGYAPQLDNVFSNLTVDDNLAMGAYIRGRDPEIREDKEEIYRLFPEIARRRAQKAKTLSGGERQMLAVARALMARPKLLLLDEPTAGLAPKAAQALLSKITEIRKKGVTILLVEQNVRKALRVADHVYVLVSGNIIKEIHGRNLVNVNIEELFFKGAG